MKWLRSILSLDLYMRISFEILLMFKLESSFLCTTNLLLSWFPMSPAVSSCKFVSVQETFYGVSTVEGTVKLILSA